MLISSVMGTVGKVLAGKTEYQQSGQDDELEYSARDSS